LQARQFSCLDCGLLIPDTPAQQQVKKCRRCGGTLHSRHQDSLNRTWALLIAAMILYVPANLMPITLTTALGSTEGDTIMQGVIYFLFSGDWPVALVIFTASILVPLLKMAALTYLLVSVQRHSSHRPLDRTKIYRMVEFVGRWSMIDVFVRRDYYGSAGTTGCGGHHTGRQWRYIFLCGGDYNDAGGGILRPAPYLGRV
jgi:paraquat-inducible protein A